MPEGAFKKKVILTNEMRLLTSKNISDLFTGFVQAMGKAGDVKHLGEEFFEVFASLDHVHSYQ